MTEPDFLPGLELSRRFYGEAVLPVLERTVPGVAHSAARLGSGSEVLGFDTARSADHEWGPRLQVFLSPGDVGRHGERIAVALSEQLPKTFAGYPTHFAPTGEARDIRFMQATDGPVHHRVDVVDTVGWMTGLLGFDPSRDVSAHAWLSTPAQRLGEATAGAVFHDGLGQLGPVRERLAWYPRDLWLHVLACQWHRIAQEEAFVGRCGEVGDELGSAVVAARLVRDLMRLVLLMDRRYPPYSKWLGSAFARTGAAGELTPHLAAALAAADWRVRERHLVAAYERVATLHNDLALTEPVDPATQPYHGRPFQVLHADRFTAALRRAVQDPGIRALPLTGAVDQFVDSTDALGEARFTGGFISVTTA
jgi:hypothetical protein